MRGRRNEFDEARDAARDRYEEELEKIARWEEDEMEREEQQRQAEAEAEAEEQARMAEAEAAAADEEARHSA
jgi:hypothetical protein